MKRTSFILVLMLTAVVFLIAACAPAATPTQAVVEEPAPVEEATEAWWY